MKRSKVSVVFLSFLVIMLHIEGALAALPTFDWSLFSCDAFSFGTMYDYCGVLEFCRRKSGDFYGYRQYGNPTSPCISPGPVIRVEAGKKYLLTLRNLVHSVTTNIHTHGLHISGDGNADNSLLVAETNQCIHYSWIIPSNHMGGTFWYHSHKHKSSSYQVSNGAYGMFIVEDNFETLLPADISGADSIKAFLGNEILVMGSQSFDLEWLGNGVKGGANDLSINLNEWTRIRLSISNPYQQNPVGNVLPVSISECADEAYVIAYDGVYVTDVPGRKLPVGITGASRLDIAVRCSDPNIGYAILKYGLHMMANITIKQGTGSMLPSPFTSENQQWSPIRPYYLRDFRSLSSVDNNFVVNLTNFAINDVRWDVTTPLAQFNMSETNEWTIYGSHTHPIHLHVQHVQVLSPCGDHEIGQFYDTIVGEEACVVRLAFDDYSGITLLHCHDLDHEDSGMMTLLYIIGDKVVNGNPDFADRTCYALPIPPTPAPTPAPVKATCRSMSQNKCEGRLGKDGYWMHVGGVDGALCRQKCAFRDNEIDGRTDWKCGQCSYASRRRVCSNALKCSDSAGRDGFMIHQRSIFGTCRTRCVNLLALDWRLKYGNWRCGRC